MNDRKDTVTVTIGPKSSKWLDAEIQRRGKQGLKFTRTALISMLVTAGFAAQAQTVVPAFGKAEMFPYD